MWIQERPSLREGRQGRQARADIDGRPDQEGESRLRQWVERLAIPRHRIAHAHNNRRVANEIATELDRLGYHVHIQGVFRNIVALPKQLTSDPLTFVGAHFDSVPHSPGADDNASGLAVLLECARSIATIRPTPAVGFLAFNAEEDGMLGSRDFVANGLPELRSRGLVVRLVHVLEMVGFRSFDTRPQRLPLPWVPARLRSPDFVGLLTNGASRAVVDQTMRCTTSPGLRVLTAKTWGAIHKVLPDLARSDHLAFWEGGIPASLWTDTANFRNPNYHLVSDTPDTLDYRFMDEIAALLESLVLVP